MVCKNPRFIVVQNKKVNVNPGFLHVNDISVQPHLNSGRLIHSIANYFYFYYYYYFRLEFTIQFDLQVLFVQVLAI